MTGLAPDAATKGLTLTEWPGGARFSPDDSESAPYRTWLWRLSPWITHRQRVAFICLNPSTARADMDDATVRKLIGFARRWNFGALDIFNLWDFRTKSPAVLARAEYPLGPSNDVTLSMQLSRASRIVCAWGADSMVRRHPERVRHVRRIAEASCPDVVALRLTKDGFPYHPLYVPYAATPLPYRLGVG